MRGVNRVTLIGNLGNDPDIRYTASGAAVANISLATTASWRDKESGEQQERTEWHRVIFFSQLAEIVGKYLRKGSKVYIEGRLQTRKWQDKEGNDRYTTEIVAKEMQMLDSRGDSGTNEFNQTTTPAQTAPAPSNATSKASDDFVDDFVDDEIPF